MKKRMLSFLVAALLLACLPINAFAHEVPNPKETGSIKITMRLGEKTVPGGTLSCTRVGYIDSEDGNYFFRRIGDGKKVEDVRSEDAAQDMVEYVMDYKNVYNFPKNIKTIDKNGVAKFEQLETGLYLITQTSPAEGYYAIKPFIVGVPNNVDGHYVYDVSINAKTEPEKIPEPTKPTPSKPTGPKLPQTGQLTWPIPVLAAAGLLLLVVGFVLRKEKKHET